VESKPSFRRPSYRLPTSPVTGTAPLVSYMSASCFAQKAGPSLLTVLGLVSLLLAMLGLYRVMAYTPPVSVHERLGFAWQWAHAPVQVLTMVLREGVWLCVIRVAAGIAPALLLSRLASSVLFGLGSSDPPTYAAAVSVLVCFALVAAWLPARRAANINPVEALHWE
jgi:putative ABC transport system permease protein